LSTFLLSSISVLATVLIGYGIVKLADLFEWLRWRNMPKILKYQLLAVIFIIAIVLVMSTTVYN